DDFDLAGGRVQGQQPVLVVGDVQAPVGAEGQAVGLAVILDDQLDVAAWRGAEYPPPGNVAEPQVALRIEDRSLDEAAGLHAGTLQLQPGRDAVEVDVLLPQAGEHGGGGSWRSVEHDFLWKADACL